MQKLDLSVSDKVIRKLKALSALEGCKNPVEMEQISTALFERALDNAIASHLGEITIDPTMSVVPATPKRTTGWKRAAKAPSYFENDGLSDGLGDDMDYDAQEPEPETDAFAMVPKMGGLSDRDLERDMDVDDPGSEAKAEPPSPPSPVEDADKMFAQIAGIALDQTDPDDEIDHRIAKRKKKIKHKAIVTEIYGEPSL